MYWEIIILYAISAYHCTFRRQREIVTPTLFECTMSGDAERLYNVLEEGDCVSPVSGFGQWPLYLAVENGHLPVVRLLCEVSLKI